MFFGSDGTGEGWEKVAGFNLYVHFGLHRRHYFKLVGALGAGESMDPEQYARILGGCRRAGITNRHALACYVNHAALDVQHGDDWCREVIAPLVERYPQARGDIVPGTLMRINTTRRYYDFLHRALTTPAENAAGPRPHALSMD